MGKKWDKLWDFRKDTNDFKRRLNKNGHQHGTDPYSKGAIYKAGLEAQLWHTQWLTEAYRVLKPGGSMLVMGGTRTHHRLMVAIEDTGFIIKDTLMWIYGSGFPKAQDLGKMIDKRNGRKVEDYKQLGEYLKRQRGDRPQKEISKFFPSKTGGLTGCVANWELGLNVPTKSQWQILKKELSLDDKFDWLIEREEVEREKIGEINKARAEGQKSALPTMGAKTKYIDIDITTPSTDLAKHWDGFKVGGIKPAYEPIVWAVKPPEGSYIDNVLKWGVGAVNVDECRIGTEKHTVGMKGRKAKFWAISRNNQQEKTVSGRFPANVILSHHPECEQVGVKKVKGNDRIGHENKLSPSGFLGNKAIMHSNTKHADSNGLETVESWDCHPDCAIRIMDEQSGDSKSSGTAGTGESEITYGKFKRKIDGYKIGFQDNGGASRFFYCAKASRGERNRGLEGMEEKNKPVHIRQSSGRQKAGKMESLPTTNNHPTVKPIALFEWLIKLVTREGQIVLDPFLGSGTTAIAAHKAGRECVGIEREDDYVEIAKRRIEHWESQPQQQELRA